MTFYTSAWIHVVIGSLAIALGGYLTTKGWNQFNNHAEKISLVTAAQREWRQNDTYLGLMAEHYSKLDDIDAPLVMSTLHKDVFQEIFTSYLFDNKNKKDDRLLDAISSYLLNITPLNDSITKINNIVSSKIESDYRNKTLSDFYSSALLTRFQKRHIQLGQELDIIDNATSLDSRIKNGIEQTR